MPAAHPPAAVPPILSKPAVLAFLALAALVSPGARAERQTVCTITVNSADEREVFRRNLPPDQFDFVELVEHGRPDWLSAACRRKVRCDVLVVSGHFAGTEFYSSRPEVDETLSVDEMERVSCGGSCPDLFSHLKEVYLFGCDSLKSEAPRSAMPEVVRGLVRAGRSPADAQRFAKALSERYAEDARDRMRRVFPGVPVIYGFSALAPYGRVSGPMLQHWFDQGGGADVGRGEASARLLRLFAPASMIETRGLLDTDAFAADRAEACRYYDDRLSTADKIRVVAAALHGDAPDVRMGFARIEAFLTGLDGKQRAQEEAAQALVALAADGLARERYLGMTRDTAEPTLRLRMIALASDIGWLSGAQRHAEVARLVSDLISAPGLGYGDVDLICTLKSDGTLGDAAPQLPAFRTLAEAAPHAAARACLGSDEARARVLRALASADEDDVRAAQAYLRHRPITDAAELRAAAARIAQVANPAAQARALETLARLHIEDRPTLDALAQLFAGTRSLAVQRAVAEIFLRSDRAALPRAELATLLRRHRRPSPDGADLIDTLLRQLETRG